jgi:hypothetical protein
MQGTGACRTFDAQEGAPLPSLSVGASNYSNCWIYDGYMIYIELVRLGYKPRNRTFGGSFLYSFTWDESVATPRTAQALTHFG